MQHRIISEEMWKSGASPGFAETRARQLGDEVRKKFEKAAGGEEHITKEHFVQHLQEVVAKGKEHKKSDGKSFNILSLRAMRDYLKKEGKLPNEIAAELRSNEEGKVSVVKKQEATTEEILETEREETAAEETTAEAAKTEAREEGKQADATKATARSGEKQAEATEKLAETEEKGNRSRLEAIRDLASVLGGIGKNLGRGMGGAKRRVGDTVAKVANSGGGRTPRTPRTPSEPRGEGFATIVLLLTIALAISDFFFLRFGGLDYNIYMNAWASGGFDLIWRTFVPIYALAILLIIEIVSTAEARNTLKFFLLLIGLLLAAKTITAFYDMSVVPFVGLPISIVAIVISMVISIKFMDDPTRFYSWVALVLVVSAIFSLGGLFNPSGLFHLIIAILVRQYIVDRTGGNKTRANFVVAGLLAFDFFGFGLFKLLIPNVDGGSIIFNRFIVPIWFLYVGITSLEEGRGKFAKWLTILVLIFYVIALVDTAYGWVDIRAQMRANPDDIVEARSFFTNAFAKVKSIPNRLMDEYKKGLEQATGGYYQGKVEENQDPRNDLGVHIANLQAADKEFYQNEEVIVWGDLKAKTLEDPINLFMSCEAGDIKGEIRPEKLSKINPAERHTIQQLEQIPFECRFQKDELEAGTTSIKIKAEFNFNTLGYLKTYFMDVERMRALRKENVDPLRQYGINKVSDAIYTNGPVKLGMGTVDPPLGLGTGSDAYSYVGVTVQPQWFGKIKNITSVQIQVPVGLDISDPGSSSYCRQGFTMTDDDKEGYAIYDMTKSEIKKTKVPIDTYKSWRCSIKVPSSITPDILGNTPITTHYYRAEVGYIYEIEKSTNVFIKGVEGTERSLSDCEKVCDDDDGCICNNDACGVPKDTKIKKGYTCNDAPVGSNKLIGSEDSSRIIDRATSDINAYITLNALCAEGKSKEAEEALESSDLEEIEKEAIRNLLRECSDEITRAIQIEDIEKKVIKQVEEVVAAAETMESKTISGKNREKLDNRLDGFVNLLDDTKNSFKDIKDKINSPQDPIYENHIERIDTAQEKLKELIAKT